MGGRWRLAHTPSSTSTFDLCLLVSGFALDALALKHTQHTPETNVSSTGAPTPAHNSASPPPRQPL